MRKSGKCEELDEPAKLAARERTPMVETQRPQSLRDQHKVSALSEKGEEERRRKRRRETDGNEGECKGGRGLLRGRTQQRVLQTEARH